MYAVSKGRRERDIVRPSAPVQIAPELPTAATRCIREFNPASQEIWCGNADLYQIVWYKFRLITYF